MVSYDTFTIKRTTQKSVKQCGLGPVEKNEEFG